MWMLSLYIYISIFQPHEWIDSDNELTAVCYGPLGHRPLLFFIKGTPEKELWPWSGLKGIGTYLIPLGPPAVLVHSNEKPILSHDPEVYLPSQTNNDTPHLTKESFCYDEK